MCFLTQFNRFWRKYSIMSQPMMVFRTYNQQKCFIAYTHKASWSEDILAACTEVLPRFGLEAWYADDQFEPGRSLKEKVVEMIANARYGIFDLSAMYDTE